MSNWWGTRKNVSARLVWEVEAMKATFGNTFKLVVPPFGGLLYWQGVVEINMSILDSPRHSLKLVYPKEYPNRPAEAYCVKPRIYSEKHQYEDGQLCSVQSERRRTVRLESVKIDSGDRRRLGDSVAVRVLHLALHGQLARH